MVLLGIAESSFENNPRYSGLSPRSTPRPGVSIARSAEALIHFRVLFYNNNGLLPLINVKSMELCDTVAKYEMPLGVCHKAPRTRNFSTTKVLKADTLRLADVNWRKFM